MPNTPFRLSADSNFKLLFAWNETKSARGVVALLFLSPASAKRCALHLVSGLQRKREGLGIHLQEAVKAFH